MNERLVRIEGRNLKLTNLDKIFWPKEGITKGELIAYYEMIADRILPYLIDRPQSLNRYPDGITGESFYQKNVLNRPKWLKIYPKRNDQGKVTNYVICNDRATLIYLVNLGCIELNVWSSRISTPEYPDYLVIDLDPLEINFESVRRVALEFSKLLHSLGVASYPKTSGKDGLHIYVPLQSRYNYDLVREFAHLICLKVNRRLPQLTSLERLPENRRGKVYLDYLQNRAGATMAAPYSVRPVEGATISMPLTWDEVATVSPADFCLRGLGPQLTGQDGFRAVLGEGADLQRLLHRISESLE